MEVTPQRDRVAKPYKGRFWSAKSYVMHTLADSKSAQMRQRVLAFVRDRRRAGSAAAAACAPRPSRCVSPVDRSTSSTPSPSASSPRCCGPPPNSPMRPARTAPLSPARSPRWPSPWPATWCAALEVLIDLGLGYLSLSRATPTLSPGEMQRLRIATQLRSGLFGVIYVLDEPSAGLHPADAEPLLVVLEQLKASGNSVFVVEHNMDVVRRADWLVDVGPRAGDGGGEVLYSGPVAGPGRGRRPRSPAATCSRPAPTRARHRAPRQPAAWLGLTGVTRHNLVDLDVRGAARRAHRGHRRLRVGQVHPGEPGAGGCRGPGTPPGPGRRRTVRRRDRRRRRRRRVHRRRRGRRRPGHHGRGRG